MNKFLFIILFGGLMNLNAEGNTKTDDELFNRAVELSKKLLIIDTHIDIPYRLKHHWEDISVKTNSGHFDYERATQGGLNAAFMSIYIPADLGESNEAFELADTLIDMVEYLTKTYPNKFAIAVSTEDIKNQFGKGIISFPMGMENGSALNRSFEKLKHFYDRGIRYITLTHSKSNHICDSSYDPNKRWKGLSPFGKSLIPEMNKLGIMVDISHVSDDAFYQAVEISKVPVIATHSSCRFYTPNFERNMSDEMIKKLAEKGGVIQITFGSYFISGDFNRKSEEIEKYLNDHNLSRGSEEGKNYVDNYLKDDPMKPGTVKDVADHIDHVVKLVGIDHVGLGSDFEGVNTLPENLKDASYYPYIIYELLKKNYSESDIEKICSGNMLRVWKQTEDFAKSLK
ncbi:MAG: dipeptidase [Ignavibacteriae bacterium]|nr:dipeptidase [Ignavibacteriota bacterium]